MGIIEVQLAELQREFPSATAETRPDGSSLITIHGVALPRGWSQATTSVHFLAPLGFPMAQPDCFWADENLRLAAGGLPKNSGVQAPPFSVGQKLWFSWHVSQWNGSRSTLRSFVGVILNRLSCVE